MNPSHNPTLSSAEPLRTPTNTTALLTERTSGERASASFNALYHSETASLDDEYQTKHGKNNNLDDMNKKDNEGTLIADKPILGGDIDELTKLSDHELTREDQSFEIELLHGITVALPSNSPQTKTGEKLPLSGKVLPQNSERSEQGALLARPSTEFELENVIARTDSGVESRGRGDFSERSTRLRQNNAIDLSSTHSDLSINGHKLETTQSRILSEPLPEGLSLLASKPLQEPATALTTGSNSPTSLPAVTSQSDSTAELKLSLAADTGFNASAHSSRFDRSDALGQKIHWMHNAKISIAELHLHPAELGSIEIKIVTEDQQARVSFITSSAATRDVIEESLPKLRELLADSGITLDQSDISQKESGHEPAQRDQQALSENSHIDKEIEGEFTATPISTRIGQVDHYV
ncbi:MAG: flagellar hook-length control protein FliK [Gammaproteobacteria bacterium]|nr:flagellar hook-length control protein FliK [Gammaproteobacteria bacterium]